MLGMRGLRPREVPQLAGSHSTRQPVINHGCLGPASPSTLTSYLDQPKPKEQFSGLTPNWKGVSPLYNFGNGHPFHGEIAFEMPLILRAEDQRNYSGQ